ncbi:hypothetical protein MMC25_007850 [Agyrium rufum]|nr:hypothetical protein [Agyrium rufum]
MSKLIVVLGVTGVQGSSVAKTFLETPGWRVRGVTRNPDKPAAIALRDKGVSIIKADLNDIESLKLAFNGATAIFSLTDFWAPIFTPSIAANAEAEKRGIALNQYAYELEIQQGINVATAASDILVMKTLTHFVYSALADSSKRSNGKYRMNLHFESKGKVVEQIRERLPDLERKMSTVQMGMYITNWRITPAMGPQKREDGKFIYQVVDGEQGVSKIPWVVAHKDTGLFVRALVQSSPGKHLLGATKVMTQPEYLDLWTKTLNVPNGGIEAISIADFCGQMPNFLHAEMYDTMMFVKDFGWTGGDKSVVMPSDVRVFQV